MNRFLDDRSRWSGLTEPDDRLLAALQSLGVGGYSQPRQARAALNRAGQTMIAVDPAYELVKCERRGGGWCLVIRRISGARARATARRTGQHRDTGIAAKKQRRHAERAERHAVCQIIDQSLNGPRP